MRFLAVLAGFLAAWPPVIAAELTVFADGPARPAIMSVTETFKSSTGHSVTFVFAAGPALTKRLLDGEHADVLIAPKRYLDEVAAASKAATADARLIGSAGFSLAVRKGEAIPDISTADALRAALLKADAVVFNNVGSGNYFATVIERLGLSQALAGKIVRLAPEAVFDRVANARALEIAVGTTPLILEDSRLQTLGELPQEFQSRLELFAVPLAGARDRGAAEALMSHLTAPDTRKRLAAAGLN